MDNTPDVLQGTVGWFLWNGSALGRDWPAGLRHLMHASGAQSIAIKTYDGGDGFTQPFTIPDMKRELSDLGPVVVGAWGYHYASYPEATFAQVDHALHRLQADYVILNVEDPSIERDPRTAEIYDAGLRGLRERWPNASLYFCSHAQPKYHTSQPYYQATVHGLIHQPMIYHTAMNRGPIESIDIAMEQYRDYGLIPVVENGALRPWSAAGGSYDVPGHPIRAEDMIAWSDWAIEWGATSLVWWAADSVMDRPDLLEAVAASRRPMGKEKDRDCD